LVRLIRVGCREVVKVDRRTATGGVEGRLGRVTNSERVLRVELGLAARVGLVVDTTVGVVDGDVLADGRGDICLVESVQVREVEVLLEIPCSDELA
jgi:hypothetical protein